MPVDMVRQMAPRLLNDTAPWNAYDYIEQCFPFDVEGDVLYDNRSRNDLVVGADGGPGGGRGCVHMAQRGRTPGRGQIGVVGGRERAIIRYTNGTFKSLLGMARKD